MRGPLKTKRRGGSRKGLPPSGIELLLVLGLHERFVAARTRALIAEKNGTEWKEVRKLWAIASEGRRLYKEALAKFIREYLREGHHEDAEKHPRCSASHEGRDRGSSKGKA